MCRSEILSRAESGSIDWDKGLPPDVLALVAQAGGIPEMKAMRRASKNWQGGYDLGVTGIRISSEKTPIGFGDASAHPRMMLEPEDEVGIYGTRFPGLARLDVGDSSANESWLRIFGAFPKLASLNLGNPRAFPPPWRLSATLTPAREFSSFSRQRRSTYVWKYSCSELHV